MRSRYDMKPMRRQFLASSIGSIAVTQTRERPPTIVFVLADDQRWNTLGRGQRDYPDTECG
jgi:hypothetical protein